MQKKYTSLGLMSGTSGDGVDASIIETDGINRLDVIVDKYFEYDSSIFKEIHNLKEKIFNINDLERLNDDLKKLEREITFFHAKIIKEFEKKKSDFLVGFHGQTMFHNPSLKISKQLGDGRLLNQLTKKNIIFNFRKNDILHGGEGAPLTPIFHQLIVNQKNIIIPVGILNIGGISNITIINNSNDPSKLVSKDVGPGNCLIDLWIRKNSSKKFDYNGQLANLGNINEIIFEQAQELYSNRKNKQKLSFDINDFDISFARGLSLEDGAATLTEFSASIISETILTLFQNLNTDISEVLICGGGRNNEVLINSIKNKLPPKMNFKLIDDYGINGDFVESQAFAFLAVRSYLKLPISYPSTTNCSKPCTGGELIKS